MSQLRLSEDFSLPLSAVTESIAIVAKRRVGKSYLMRRFVEQLIIAKQQVVIIDPKGDQWGLCFSADGKGPGLPVVILGGEHGHVPLEPTGGELVAQLVVEDRVSVLIDLSLFRKHQVATFMAHFLEAIYRLKAKESNRTPMMLVIDEADAIAPQNPKGSSQNARGEGAFDNTARMLGAAEDIVRRGGQRGIGCLLVTQRSAVLNKNVLTQAQVLIALRTIAPQDIKALEAWLDVHGTPEQRKVLMDSLASLPVGDAWVWSPGWPTDEGIFQRIHVAPITTFDSAATPKPGEKIISPKNPADVDLEVFKQRMAATIEKAKADDPAELRKQIAGLKKELAVPQKIAQIPITDVNAIARAVEKATTPLVQKIDGLETIIAEAGLAAEDFAKAATTLAEEATRLKNVLTDHTTIAKLSSKTVARKIVQQIDRAAESPVRQHVSEEPQTEATSHGTLSKPVQKLIDSLAELETMGVTPVESDQLSVYLGIKVGLSTFRSLRADAKKAGLIEYVENRTALTDAGRVLARAVPAKSQKELQEFWLGRLSGPAARMLAVLIDAYPQPVPNDILAELAGVDRTKSTFRSMRAEIKNAGLCEYLGDSSRASALLFPEGLI